MKYGIKIIKDGNVFHYKEDNKVKYFESKDDAIAMMELLKETMKLYYSFEIMEKKVMI
jgi:hypothetical protein